MFKLFLARFRLMEAFRLGVSSVLLRLKDVSQSTLACFLPLQFNWWGLLPSTFKFGKLAVGEKSIWGEIANFLGEMANFLGEIKIFLGDFSVFLGEVKRSQEQGKFDNIFLFWGDLTCVSFEFKGDKIRRFLQIGRLLNSRSESLSKHSWLFSFNFGAFS